MSDIQAAAQAQIREGAQALADKLVRAGLDGVLVDAVGLVLQYREEELRAALRVRDILAGGDESERAAHLERLTNALQASRDACKDLHKQLADACRERDDTRQELASCREELRGTREALKAADAHLQEIDQEEPTGLDARRQLATKAFRLASRRAAWRHYAGFAMTSRGQFAFNQIMEIADKALEAEEARFGIFK